MDGRAARTKPFGEGLYARGPEPVREGVKCVSVAAGALDRWVSRWGCCRRRRSPDQPLAVGAAEASDWTGLGAPKNTLAAIVEKLNKEINAGLADPQLKVRIADLGGAVLGGSPAKFGGVIAEETEKWAKVIRAAGVKAE
jgi:hypothetical protein